MGPLRFASGCPLMDCGIRYQVMGHWEYLKLYNVCSPIDFVKAVQLKHAAAST